MLANLRMKFITLSMSLDTALVRSGGDGSGRPPGGAVRWLLLRRPWGRGFTPDARRGKPAFSGRPASLARPLPRAGLRGGLLLRLPEAPPGPRRRDGHRQEEEQHAQHDDQAAAAEAEGR